MARPGNSKRPPSMHDVAAVAGVSHQTVSRVLNGSESVSDATRQRVQAAIKELGYRRNSFARALVTRRGGIIGVITTTDWHYGPTSILLSVEHEARKAGYYPVVAPVDETDNESVTLAVEHFMNLNVEAIIFIAPAREVTSDLWEGDLNIPLVLVTAARPSNDLEAVRISNDNERATRELMGYLFDKGHRAIAHVAGPEASFEAQMRAGVYAEMMRERDLPVRVCVSRGWSADVGYQAAQELVAQELPTAVFCGNDEIATGLYRGFSETGVKIPDDVSVVGYDDLPHTRFMSPALTTIAQDFHALGKEVLSCLHLAITEGKISPPVYLPSQLVKRESVKDLLNGERSVSDTASLE